MYILVELLLDNSTFPLGALLVGAAFPLYLHYLLFDF